MNNRCKFGIGLLTLLIFSIGFLSVHTVFAQANQAESKLQITRNAVNQAYNVILDAEKAGANIYALLDQLNEATDLLAQAENAYRSGDTSEAIVKADAAILITQQIIAFTGSVKADALNSTSTSFWSTIAFSLVGSIVAIFVLLFIWRRVKQSYPNRLIGAKPEVVTNES